MMKKLIITGTALVVLLVAVTIVNLFGEYRRIESDDPLVWSDIVKELETKTEWENPPANAVLFVGSSSIRFWDSLREDMAPLPVIQHGFGGAKIHDVVYFAEPLITRWQVSKVVIFVGSNDINGNDNHHLVPAYIGEQLRKLFDIIFQAKPDTQVFYIAITPTKFSWDKWASVQEANRIASSVCDDYDNATFIDPTDLFLNEEGEPNGDLFVIDGLHLNKEGYALWTSHIKPYLIDQQPAD